MAFRGHYEHSLDSKDRLTVPARFREQLSKGVVLVEGLEPCVWIFPAKSYGDFTSSVIGATNPLSERGRTLRRHFSGKAFEEKLDSAGRIRVSKHLLEHAGLEGECVIVGMDDWFEVWHPDRWAPVNAEVVETVKAAAESAAEAG